MSALQPPLWCESQALSTHSAAHSGKSMLPSSRGAPPRSHKSFLQHSLHQPPSGKLLPLVHSDHGSPLLSNFTTCPEWTLRPLCTRPPARLGASQAPRPCPASLLCTRPLHSARGLCQRRTLLRAARRHRQVLEPDSDWFSSEAAWGDEVQAPGP